MNMESGHPEMKNKLGHVSSRQITETLQYAKPIQHKQDFFNLEKNKTKLNTHRFYFLYVEWNILR